MIRFSYNIYKTEIVKTKLVIIFLHKETGYDIWRIDPMKGN